jgi:hypothetical protein
VSATGYETLSDDVPIHVQLSPSQTLAKTIHVYKGSTIQVNVTDALGNPYPSEVTVYVGSTDRGKAGGSVTFQNACGCTTISTLGGEKVVPGSYTVTAVARVGALYFFSPASAQATQNVPNAYPTNLTKSFTAKLPLAAVPVTTVTVTVRQGATPLGNARVDISGGAGPSFVTGTTTSGGTNDGKVTLTVPSGSNYKITAWDSSGTLTGQLTNVSFSSGSASSTVQVS